MDDLIFAIYYFFLIVFGIYAEILFFKTFIIIIKSILKYSFVSNRSQ